MTYPHASLSDKQARETWFCIPEFRYAYELALGAKGYQQFKSNRQSIRASGGELDLIGWPDGTSVTYHRLDGTEPIDVNNLVDTYRASATMFRIVSVKSA